MENRSRDPFAAAAVVVAVIALVTGFIAVGFAVSDDDGRTLVATEPAPAEVRVKLAEFSISPAEVRVAAGGTLQVANKGAAPHDLSVVGTPLHTPLLAAGDEATLALGNLKPGTYKLRCEVPGHEGAGMTATLVVDGDREAGGDAPTTEPASPHRMSPDEMDRTMHDRTAAFPQKTAGKGAQPLAAKVDADGTKIFELTAEVVQWEVEAGKKVEAWAYNGTVPGPTISVDVGDRVRVVLHNKLPESTSLHFHGIRMPNAMDGVPDITQPPVKPGESFTYEFTASRVEVGMYHSHHNAAKQVSNGLLGTFLVGRLPMPAGVTPARELPMVLNDSGTIGFSLNGKSFPATEPVAAKPGE